MEKILKEIKAIETEIEENLWAREVKEEFKKAFKIYQEAEEKLLALDLTKGDAAFAEQQRVLSYCLLRQGNVLRQTGKGEEALALSEREIAAARVCENDVALGRSLMSNGTNRIIAGDVEKGLEQIEEARELFESGESYDHKQGLGWVWVLKADLANGGLIKKEASEIIEVAGRALEVLVPIENWPGVARAYGARAKAHESLGNEDQATADRKEQKRYDEMGGQEE